MFISASHISRVLVRPPQGKQYWSRQVGLPLNINVGGQEHFGSLSQVYELTGVVTHYGSLNQEYIFGIDPAIGSAELTTVGAVLFSAAGIELPVDGAALVGPIGTVSSNSGATAILTGPSATLTSTATCLPIAAAELVGPSGSVAATSTTGAVGTSVIVGPSGVLESYCGDTAVLSIAPYGAVVSASGITGAIGSAVLTITTSPVLGSQSSIGAQGSAELVGPSLTTVPTGHAWLVGPSLNGYASGGEIVAVTYEAYAINLSTGAVSHYTNYPFDNILRFGNSYYGVSASGVYLLGGNLDLTLPIEAHVKTFMTDFGTKNQKRVPYVYASGRSDSGVVVGITADEGPTYEYESAWGEVVGSTNHRSVIGRGIRGVYYGIDVKNVDGGSLELDEISAHIALTQRAI